MPRHDPRFAREEPDEYSEDELDREEPVDQGDDQEAGGEDRLLLALALKSVRVLEAGLVASQAGDYAEAARHLSRHRRLVARLNELNEQAEEMEASDG